MSFQFTKEFIIKKKLFPYISFYIAGYEEVLAGEGGVEEAAEDLNYFRNETIRMHEEKELSDAGLIAQSPTPKD